MHDNLIDQPSLPNKELHEWGESVGECEYMINHILFAKNQIVLDLMMGSGTTAIATINQKRKFIGIEIDEERFNVAKGRIAQHLQEAKNG